MRTDGGGWEGGGSVLNAPNGFPKVPERSGSVLAVTPVRQVSKSITLMASEGGEGSRCDGGAFTDSLQSVFSSHKGARSAYGGSEGTNCQSAVVFGDLMHFNRIKRLLS